MGLVTNGSVWHRCCHYASSGKRGCWGYFFGAPKVLKPVDDSMRVGISLGKVTEDKKKAVLSGALNMSDVGDSLGPVSPRGHPGSPDVPV